MKKLCMNTWCIERTRADAMNVFGGERDGDKNRKHIRFYKKNTRTCTHTHCCFATVRDYYLLNETNTLTRTSYTYTYTHAHSKNTTHQTMVSM